MKKLQYKIYKHKMQKLGSLYFGFEEWLRVEQLKKEGKEYKDEYGCLNNVIFM